MLEVGIASHPLKLKVPLYTFKPTLTIKINGNTTNTSGLISQKLGAISLSLAIKSEALRINNNHKIVSIYRNKGDVKNQNPIEKIIG